MSAAHGATPPREVIALVDGEHHPPVVRDALERIARTDRIAAVLFAGGEEKVSEGVLADTAAHYGFEVTLPAGGVRAGLRELAGGSPPTPSSTSPEIRSWRRRSGSPSRRWRSTSAWSTARPVSG